MKVYISGPMTGLPESNHPAFYAAEEQFAFYAAEEQLKKCGHKTVNPAVIAKHLREIAFFYEDPEPSWLDYMAADLHVLPRCDGIYMLRGWWRSRGARIEFVLALMMRKKIRFQKRNKK